MGNGTGVKGSVLGVQVILKTTSIIAVVILVIVLQVIRDVNLHVVQVHNVTSKILPQHFQMNVGLSIRIT